MIYTLLRFPMSPSSNKLYASVRGRLIKSASGRTYELTCNTYAALNWSNVVSIRKAVHKKTIRVDYDFVFSRSSLFTKSGSVKKLDYANRIKAAQDQLCEMIETDDSMVVSGFCRKSVSFDDREYINIKISLDEIISI
jgi:hypothetical protein